MKAGPERGEAERLGQSSKPDPVSPLATPLEASSPGLVRPPVARTLTYEDALHSNRGVILKGGNVTTAGSPRKGQAAGAAAQTLREVGGNVLEVLVSSSSGARHQQDQDKPQQHCPAIQKLMQGQRSGSGSGSAGVLQPVSESPENRLCDNGVPVEHQHQPHLLPHYHQHQEQQHHLHHHHHHHQMQQLPLDLIKRLFQSQPGYSLLTPLSPQPLQQNIPSQPFMVDSVAPSKPQTGLLHKHSSSAMQGKDESS